METCELICNITKNIKDSISADTVIGTPIRGNGFTVIPICKSITGFACGGGEADGKATVKKRLRRSERAEAERAFRRLVFS